MSLFKQLKKKITGTTTTAAPKSDAKPKDPAKDAKTDKKPAVTSEAKAADATAKPKAAGAGPAATATAPAKTLKAAVSSDVTDEKTDAGQKGSPATTPSTASSAPAPLQRRLSKGDLLKAIPSFQDTPATNRQALFIQKLRLCSIMFEWGEDGNDAKSNRAKEVKRQQLLELVEYIGKNKGIFTDAVLMELMHMVKTNLFRALPPKANDHPAGGKETSTGGGGAGEGEEEDPVMEPSWPHLQIVYEFFLRFIVSSEVDVRTLKKHINGQFVLKLLELFDSEDLREREYLKTILHRIYAKFMSLRAFIRKAINNVFYTFIYETEAHNGIAELLEILGSIINGFALPLKQEHKTFLKKVLTPMHKVRNLATFHQQLSYCITQFVDKDPHLSVPVLMGLIKYWPITNSSKEVLYLNELEEVLELTQAEEFKTMLKPLFKQISKSIGSPHFQVAERALFLWHNEYISNMIADYRHEILPVIFPVLHQNAQHWNPTVNNLTHNVLKIFHELDAGLVEECQKRYLGDAASGGVVIGLKDTKMDRKTREDRWSRVESTIPAERLSKFRADTAPPAAAGSGAGAGAGASSLSAAGAGAGAGAGGLGAGLTLSGGAVDTSGLEHKESKLESKESAAAAVAVVS